MKRFAAALVGALMLVPFLGSAAFAGDIVDTDATDKVECLFRVYIQEGGESGLDCLT